MKFKAIQGQFDDLGTVQGQFFDQLSRLSSDSTRDSRDSFSYKSSIEKIYIESYIENVQIVQDCPSLIFPNKKLVAIAGANI